MVKHLTQHGNSAALEAVNRRHAKTLQVLAEQPARARAAVFDPGRSH